MLDSREASPPPTGGDLGLVGFVCKRGNEDIETLLGGAYNTPKCVCVSYDEIIRIDMTAHKNKVHLLFWWTITTKFKIKRACFVVVLEWVTTWEVSPCACE